MDQAIWSLRQALHERRSQNDFLIADDAPWSYEMLYQEVTGRAGALGDWGVGPGRRVGLKVSQPEEFVLWFLALLVQGAVVVPINP